MDIASQNAVIRELELPVACLVYSGGKSLHAIVRVDAGSYEEYRARVDYLYKVCAKNGLDIDKQNRNPSRLSRMPGVVRGEHKQFLVDTNIGKSSFEEWRDWIESVNDDLPDEENLSTFFDDLPALAPPLIEGVLRQGHKMLVAGPSKAGKSYLLIELCCCIAEGKPWLSFPCTAGRVLYVNLELDRASCLHRFRDVYTALGFAPEHIDRIDIWNLRGAAYRWISSRRNLFAAPQKRATWRSSLTRFTSHHRRREQRRPDGAFLQPVRQGVHGARLRRDLLPPPFKRRAGRQKEHGPCVRLRCVCTRSGCAYRPYRAGADRRHQGTAGEPRGVCRMPRLADALPQGGRSRRR